MDVSLLERLVRLMSANDLNTIDVRDGRRRVVLKRGALVAPSASSGVIYTAPLAAPSHPAAHPGLASGATTSSISGPVGSAGAGSIEDANLIPIKSPMVGTFYSASSPDAQPFVTVGSEVNDDTDVCIIEAMKVFNNIKAECKGTIARVLVENGQTVEFGQPLFLVKSA
jgi:acetyl-CoA carboxylase biotin carboxyl carrier protein